MYLVGDRFLLCGNVLSVLGVGRPWVGGQAEEWGRALRRMLEEVVADLPADTVVLPGHYTDVAEEDERGLVRRALGQLLASTPELQRADPVELVASAMKGGTEDTRDVRIEIVTANLGLSDPGEQACELELGSIVCPAAAGCM